MFGFTREDTLNSWLEGAREGRTMFIDSPSAKNLIREEILRIEKESKERIDAFEALLADKRYFSSDND